MKPTLLINTMDFIYFWTPCTFKSDVKFAFKVLAGNKRNILQIKA